MRKLYFCLSILCLFFVGQSAQGQSLIHYWNFNNSTDESSLLAPSYTAGGASLTRINGASSVIQTTSNTTGQGFETLNENARNGDVAGSHLRYNNSLDGTLTFVVPTTGYENVIFKYTSRRSSAANGAEKQVIDYSLDGSSYTNLTTITTDFNGPVLQTIDFSSISGADDNANFKIKITFLQGVGGAGGNNRFDNFTLDGTSLNGDVTAPTVAFSPLNNSTGINVNSAIIITANEPVRLINNSTIDNTNVDNLVELRLNDAAGSVVAFDATISGQVITITPTAALMSSQTYYVALKANTIEDLNDNAITTIQSASFTTLSAQTQLTAGDIVFVAYRANASTPDEIAFLTFVNILPGTQINFTDGKYTDNAQPQCAGGFTWTAPASGIAAGSVVTISVDSPLTTSSGSLTGSSFGLSSGGDQIIVYTGTAAAPNYITALSTNAWVTTALTACGGSISKIPAALVDGQTSINLSTAPGNVSGNTVNAYYSGTQAGTLATLRVAILNPANWTGVGSGTPAQAWPTWSFPGPPYVISASILNQSSLSITFSTTLDNASATNVANYTGIAGLQSAVLSADNKKVVLTYSNLFVTGSSNTLNVSGVKDTENRPMTAAYVYSFTYSTSISFDKKFVSVQEEAGTLAVKIKLVNPSASSVSLVVKGSPFSTATSEDFTLVSQVLTFTGTSSLEQTINIPIINDNIGEQDEYFVLSLESATNAIITGGNLMTLYIKDNDRVAPVPTKAIELSYVNSFDPGSSTAEIVVHDPASQRLFIISSVQDRLDIADFSNPADIKLIKSIEMLPYGGITSVATKNGIVAVASPNANEQLNGSVVFFTTNGEFQKQVTVGALPDMITFSPDGKKVMTANEGQPNNSYTVDPEGSVSIIDISGGITSLDQSKVSTLLFDSFNAKEVDLIAAGVRKLKRSSTLSQDFEPEYVTISSDSRKAWVTIQENNAIGEIDLESKTITSVWAMGKKDLSAMGNGIDASDNNGIVAIANWPVKSFYLPDGIANYTVGGVHYLVTANEGDEKEYAGLTERTTVADVVLDPTVFPHAAMLKETHNIGRLRMTNLSGDIDGDGDYDEINVPGARSFTIWNAATKTKVFDSGDDFERYTSTEPSIKALFNADNENNTFKSRSRAKGPEPEGLTVASINGKSYAFIGLERVGGVMVYDITDPANAKFVDYKNSRSTTSYSGDHGPEGILYISSDNSPNGKAYIAVANEISGTVSLFEVTPTPKKDQTITFNALASKTVGDSPFALTATASSTLAISYTTTDDKITIAGAQVTSVKAGKTTITANQDGNASYNAATKISQTFCINPAKPAITMTGQDTESPVLQSNATAGNQWYKNGAIITGSTNSTLTVTTAGVYTVKATVETCESVLSSDFPVIVTGDINTVAASLLQIIPNPAKEFVKLQLPETGHKQITIYQLSGAVKEVHSTEEQEEELDVRSWNEGYYLIRVTTAKGSYYGRFIKN